MGTVFHPHSTRVREILVEWIIFISNLYKSKEYIN